MYSRILGFKKAELLVTGLEEASTDDKGQRGGEKAEGEGREEEKMSRSLGIPVKLLHEAAGHIVTVELKSGELYRGSMIECEDNWNCQLENITYTAKDGKVSQLEHVFIRGSKVRFMVIPDMLKNAPMFKRLDARIRGKGASLGVGRGRAVAMRARAAAGRGGPAGRGAVPPIRR
ncbi:Ribonucleoprotein LSM domain [Canna indica]|uniref:Small nuclear ribonucleoprotein Sm D3 n=1 Tax=Canna indica TaxID=4628 RepID=A0AAQ3QMF7_9LILI|nr:Ribonucleoprotein LSM domain [Canna indica]